MKQGTEDSSPDPKVLQWPPLKHYFTFVHEACVYVLVVTFISSAVCINYLA